MRLKEQIAISLYIGGAFLVAFVSGFAQHGLSDESAGFAVGTLLIPALIAYAVHGIGKRSNRLGFARWLWWSTFVLVWVSTANYKRQHMTTADVHTVVKQAAEMTPDSEIDNSGKSPEKIAEEAKYRDLMRSYFKEISEARTGFDNRRKAIDAKLDGVYQPESYEPARAKKIIAALKENIVLNNDIQAWANEIVPAFQARLKQSSLTDSEQQSTLRGFRNSVSDSPMWPTLHSFLAIDTELDHVSIQFYEAVLNGDVDQANSYLDRIQALGKKDTELSSQVTRLRSASLQQSGLNGSEQAFQKTSGQ